VVVSATRVAAPEGPAEPGEPDSDSSTVSTGAVDLSVDDGNVTLQVDANSTLEPVSFTMTMVTDAPGAPESSFTIVTMVRLEAKTALGQVVRSFSRPITISFKAPANQALRARVIHYFDEAKGVWVPLRTSYNASTDTYVGSTDHFTLFALVEDDSALNVNLTSQVTESGAVKVAGVTTPGATITLYVNGVALVDQAASTGSFARTLWPAAGSYEMVAVAKLGNEARASYEVRATVGARPAGRSFTDVMATRWSYGNISSLSNLGIVVGYVDNTYRPEQNVTRAEFATFLVRALALPYDASGAAGFSDAAAIPVWARGTVGGAVRAGLIMGYEDGSFRADRVISRSEMAVMLARIARNSGLVLPQNSVSFADRLAIATWALADVELSARAGLVGGFPDGTFKGDGNVTREQAAAVIDRMVELLGR